MVLPVAEPSELAHGKIQGGSGDVERDMHFFETSQNADTLLWTMIGSLDRADVGIILLDRDLRVQFLNQRQADFFGLPAVAYQTRPSFKDILREAAARSLFDVPDLQVTGFVDEQMARIQAGGVCPTRIELKRGIRLLFSCVVCADGGRIMTYTDISGELLREAAEAVDRASSDLRYSNELIEDQATNLVSLAETAHENAQTAERARQQLEHEIKERRKLEDNLRRMATTDGLTGALNRAAFMAAGQDALRQMNGTNPGCAVLMLDVDHFKSINDSFGHAGGDLALRHLVAKLRDGTRPTDLIGRVGGEEFCILVQSATAEVAAQIAQRLLVSVSESTVRHGDRLIACTVSIGLATPLALQDTFEEVIARADAALYRAKSGGRNRVVTDAHAQTERCDGFVA
jgi:diguanylate cyclase (GGDEF)-like protein